MIDRRLGYHSSRLLKLTMVVGYENARKKILLEWNDKFTTYFKGL